ncbi:hypothetical protein [Rosistilla ulvae]|nr:hypothetical protein [Rosistilla ulvae]
MKNGCGIVLTQSRDTSCITIMCDCEAGSAETPELIRIAAGNYDGRLGKSFAHLHELFGPMRPLEASAAGRIGFDFPASNDYGGVIAPKRFIR